MLDAKEWGSFCGTQANRRLCGAHTMVPSGVRCPSMCPAFVRGMSGVYPTYVRRTVKVGLNAGPSGGRVRRTEGVAIIARDVITYSDDVVTEVKQICLTILVYWLLQLQY